MRLNDLIDLLHQTDGLGEGDPGPATPVAPAEAS
jgi:hypothetical protein